MLQNVQRYFVIKWYNQNFQTILLMGIQGICLVYQFSKLLKEYMVCEFAMCIYVCIIKGKSKDTHFNLYLFFSLIHNMRSEMIIFTRLRILGISPIIETLTDFYHPPPYFC